MTDGTPLHAPWSLRELVGDLTAGRITAHQARDRALERIDATEEQLQAWVQVDPTRPWPGAGPLGGVPLGVKDIIDVAGLPTRCGSGLRADALPAAADAVVVQAWRTAGAVPLGKTVTTEFAFFAPGPTRNPADPGRTPGGSSSGSAAAVAAGQVPLALGSQTAGSVTRPASYCGVAALVMGRGRIPEDGVAGLSPSLDSHAALAARASDLAVAWSALTGEPDAAAAPPAGLRVLLWSAEPLGVVEDEMRTAQDLLRERLLRAGIAVAPFPEEQLLAEATAAHPVVMAYEAARSRSTELARADELSEPFARLLRTGAATSEADYRAARRVLVEAGTALEVLWGRYDVVLGPAAPGAAPLGLAATGDPVLSRPWQGMGLPVVTVPGMTNPAGLPLGLQVVGPREALTLAAACAVEVAMAG